MDSDRIILEHFVTSYPAQAAQTVERLPDEEIAEFMEQIPLALNLHLIRQINTFRAARCLQLIPPELAKEILDKVELDLAESLLRQVDPAFQLTLLDSMDAKPAAVLRQKLTYEADTVGASMIPSVFALQRSVVVRDALELVKQERARISSAIYVIDEEDKLVGEVGLKELFFAEPDDELAALMNTEVTRLAADMSIHAVKDHPGWLVNRTMPVTDRSGKLIGIADYALIQEANLKTGREVTREVLQTSHSLGELYRIGLTGFLLSINR